MRKALNSEGLNKLCFQWYQWTITLKTKAPSGYCMDRTRELVNLRLFRDINGHYFVIESQWDSSFIIIDF